MSEKRSFGMFLALIQLLWIPAGCAILVFLLNYRDLLSGEVAFFPEYVTAFLICEVSSLVCGLSGLGSTFLLKSWRRRRGLPSWEPKPFVSYFSGMALVVPSALVGGLTTQFLAPLFGVSFSMSSHQIGKALLFFILIFGSAFFFNLVLHMKAENAEAASRIAQLERLRLEAKVSALMMQMNPHFLFNALNTIADLVLTSPQEAEDAVLRLSRLYRSVLQASQTRYHTLQDELDLCAGYLELERLRFPDRMSYRIEVEGAPPPSRVALPVLLLQPLVENAVKHGISHLEGPGSVQLQVVVSLSKAVVVVRDDGLGIGHSPKSGTGLGLRNIRERLALEYGNEALLHLEPQEPRGTKVTLEFPLRNCQSLLDSGKILSTDG